jgi:hypothetical protein
MPKRSNPSGNFTADKQEFFMYNNFIWDISTSLGLFVIHFQEPSGKVMFLFSRHCVSEHIYRLHWTWLTCLDTFVESSRFSSKLVLALF